MFAIVFVLNVVAAQWRNWSNIKKRREQEKEGESFEKQRNRKVEQQRRGRAWTGVLAHDLWTHRGKGGGCRWGWMGGRGERTRNTSEP